MIQWSIANQHPKRTHADELRSQAWEREHNTLVLSASNLGLSILSKGVTMKDYKALSLSYQPCNRPLLGDPKCSKKKHRNRKNPDKHVQRFAAKMRDKMTPSETCLDAVLSEILPRNGLNHESQYVIGKRIADFAIPSKRLVIEVDGEYHFFRGKQDGFRTKQLKKNGWRVIRFTNHAVDTDIIGVIAEILEACGSQYAPL